MTERTAPLGPLTLLALGVNGIVGVGIFVAPPTVARAFPGPAGALAYVAVALACFPIALVYARLARALPLDGGPTLWADRAFGLRAGSAIGALAWVSALLSTAAVTRALSDRFVDGRAVVLLTTGICVALAALNSFDLEPSAWAWTALTFAKLAPLVALAFYGLFARGVPQVARQGEQRGSALLAILFALQGFEIVALPAGQARNAERTVPRATLAALLVASILYAFVHLSCVRGVADLAASKFAIPAAASTLGGAKLARAIDAGVVASMAGIAIGMHAMTPRYLAAVVRRRGRGSAPPVATVVVTATLVAVLCGASTQRQLLELASVAVLSQYGLAACALLALSLRKREGLAPRDAWPVPLALLVVGVLVLQASGRELLVAAAVALSGVLVTHLFARRDARTLDDGGHG